MKKTLLFVVLAFSSFTAFSQQNLWTKTSEEKIAMFEKFERATNPAKFELFSINFSQLKTALSSAPLDLSGIESNTIVSFPDYTGKISNYIVYEAPVMEKGLSDRYPDIKSYVGKGVNDKTATIRFSTSLFGLHVMMTSGEVGTYYIDTHTKDLNNYIVYSRKDIRSSRTFSCLVQDDVEEIVEKTSNDVVNATDGKFRQYRLAMASTNEYSAFHINASPQIETTDAEKKATVLAAMNVTMTRVNGIYEKDMSLRMNLVANNDLVIFVGNPATNNDGLDNANAGTLINQSQTVIDANIGLANYDIGHTVSTGGGGLAQLYSPCTSNKAKGITGSPAPVGDPYDVDYVAHEIGHQFGGPHTYSGTGGNCSQPNGVNAVEPASGTTIMAYAGICGPDVQSNSDPYFHAVSIASMNAFMIGTGNCAAQTNNSNGVPVIAALTNRTIPRGTAFMLTGNATDPNVPTSALTYCWEQINGVAGTDYPTSTQTTGPVYRSRNAVASPTRYFPQMTDLLEGNLTPTWEVTPNVARTLNFALTVRDNQTPTGGQTARADMVVTVDGSRGPLSVTSQNTNGVTWNQGESQTITWAINGTDTSVGGANVDILLSTDNGLTFTTVLASNTPNDGSQMITVPNVLAAYCRVMVKAAGNIFFSVNVKNIAIGYVVTTTTVCTDYTKTFSPAQAMATGWTGYLMPLITDSFTISDANFTVVSTATRTNQVSFGVVKPGSSVVDITAFDGPSSGCANNKANLNAVFDDEGVAFDCNATATGASYKPVGVLSSLDGMNSAGQWRFAAKSTSTANTISSVTLTLCETNTTAVLSSEIFDVVGFTLYPNPNNGIFNLELNAQSNDVSVLVHDMRGRLILSNNFKANGLVKETITLNKAQSGIYLVTIQDGARKTTKKIVVE